MWTSLALCVIALAVGANAECSDFVVHCSLLDRKFCLSPYDTFARDACAKTCGLCDDPPTTTTTTARTCTFEFVQNTDFSNTNFRPDEANINEPVHLLGGVDFCQGLCEQSILDDGNECRAFTYNYVEKCYLYYHTSPIYILDPSKVSSGNEATTIYIKRCSDDYKQPCGDLLPFCSLIDLANLCAIDEGWGSHNCKASCNKCGSPVTTTLGTALHILGYRRRRG